MLCLKHCFHAIRCAANDFEIVRWQLRTMENTLIHSIIKNIILCVFVILICLSKGHFESIGIWQSATAEVLSSENVRCEI